MSRGVTATRVSTPSRAKAARLGDFGLARFGGFLRRSGYHDGRGRPQGDLAGEAGAGKDAEATHDVGMHTLGEHLVHTFERAQLDPLRCAHEKGVRREMWPGDAHDRPNDL